MDLEQKESSGYKQQGKASGSLLGRALCGAWEGFISTQTMKHPLRDVSRPTYKTKSKYLSWFSIVRAGKEASKSGFCGCLGRGRGCDPAEELFCLWVSVRRLPGSLTLSICLPQLPVPAQPGLGAGSAALGGTAAAVAAPSPPGVALALPGQKEQARGTSRSKAAARGGDASELLSREMLMSTERRVRKALNRISSAARAHERPPTARTAAPPLGTGSQNSP